MRTWRRLASTLLIAAAVVAPTLSTAGPASAAPATQARYCSVVVNKSGPGQTVSAVVSRTCADNPAAAAAAAPLPGTLLVRLYQGVNWTGNWTDIYGDGGPCDSEGYNLDTSAWNNIYGITSYRVYNACWGSTAASSPPNQPGDWAMHCWDVAYVGPVLNDRVRNLKVYYSLACV